MTITQRARTRPAETGGGLGSAATFVAYALGFSVETVAAVGVIAGLLPSAITLLVDHGGVRGVLRTLLNGRK